VATLQAVLEVNPLPDNVPWPVADVPTWDWLPLNGSLTDEETGLFFAALAGYLQIPATSAAAVVDSLATAEAVMVPGGLRPLDPASGTTVVPGCCAGLEEWRTWRILLTGASTDFGHDPTPFAERRGDVMRVWQDREPELTEPFVDLPLAALPELLDGVRRDLTGFLERTGAWCERRGIDPRPLVAALDRDLAITAPWLPPLSS
jgi:hypothetical protein